MARWAKKRIVKQPPSRRRRTRWSRLQMDPLPVLSASRPSDNLPIQVTSFIGREREIAEIKQALRKTRLLTLTGPGGCGKTRLALQVAADLLGDHPDGVWLVEFGALADSALVPHMVASALAVRESLGRPVSETLVDSLRHKSPLVLLDNCEHLLPACAQLVDTLLRSCPKLHILATSREGLDIAGELTYDVPSLSLPDLQHEVSPKHLAKYEAVRLFVERAVFSHPGFELTDKNAIAVARICHRVDGIPLAIELAARRVKALSAEQIALRLDDRFRLLTGGSRTALPRHQTLRGTMDWSHGLLSEKDQALLRRLSVFARGWSLEAAEAVCAREDIEAPEVLGVLMDLVDKSLVVVEEQRGGTRYRLLETVRHYSRDRLLEAGEAADIERRHTDWFLTLAERAELELRGQKQEIWFEQLETEHDNLRAALGWSESAADGEEVGLRLAGALHWFWYFNGHWSEGRRWLEGALARSNNVQVPALAKAAEGAGILAWRQGDFERATALCEKGLAVSRELGNKELVAALLRLKGNVTIGQGNYERGEALLEESLILSRELGNKWLAAAALSRLGEARRARGDYGRAEALQTESVALFREVGDKALTAYALHNLAILALYQGDHMRATAFYREGLALCRGLPSRWAIDWYLDGLAGVACAQKHYMHAARLLGAAEALRETLGLHRTPHDQADHDRFLASTRAGLGDAGFAAAWAEGRVKALEKVIENALAPMEAVPLKINGMEKLTAANHAGLLTPREREVAALIAQGRTNREIASVLAIAARTVDTHVEHILNKLGFNARTQIAAWAVETGLHKTPLRNKKDLE